ncbi:MAG TPA: hypothetical protein VEV45_20620 [Streptosporangiaceae bacterium]|nr:hypothetical protein [Streptosporangiaceae bacterium]
MGTEGKYGTITTERGDIPEDEVLFILRGQDRLALPTIRAYLDLCIAAGCPPHHVAGIREAMESMAAWQNAHLSRVKRPGGEWP